MEEKRQYNLDFLRIFACFMVVVLHVAAQNWKIIPPQSVDWQVFNIYDVFTRSCVPLFFMISGKLFLSRDDVSIKRLFSKNILKLVFIYFIWSFLYAIDTIGVENVIASPDISKLFQATITSKYHLWYLPTLVSMYFVVPIFISMKSYKNGIILNYSALLFFIFTILRCSILILPINKSFTTLLNKFSFVFNTYYGYFLLGYLLDKYKDKFKKIPSFVLALGFLVVGTLTAVGNYYLSVKAGKAVSTLYSNSFIATFLEAILLFLLFLRLPNFNANQTTEKIIKKISAYTFFVYLFHLFLLEHLNGWFGFNSLSFNPIISVPVISLFIFVLCLIIAAIIDKIPVIRKILF